MELSPDQIMRHLHKFTSIYDEKGNEVNPIPEDVKITVYCKSEKLDEEGFCCNVISSDLGINAFMARRWILEDELQEIFNPENREDFKGQIKIRLLFYRKGVAVTAPFSIFRTLLCYRVKFF